jgi:hypothetical protein
MKISIWQQFSSNHSARFTVIGRFGTSEKAEAAGAEFGQLLEDFRSQLDATVAASRVVDEYIAAQGGGNRSEIFGQLFPELMSDAAQQFFDKYDVEWPEDIGIDWWWGDYALSELVKVVGNDVFVMTNDIDSNWTATPILTVLAKLGARSVWTEYDLENCIAISLKGNAPDQKTADEIIRIVHANIEWGEALRQAAQQRAVWPPEPDMP